MALKILTIFAIWLLTYPALILISAFAVPIMLANDWNGMTTWFGNYKYGRWGNKAMPCKTKWCAWWFLVVRNPISNFGKITLSVKSTAAWFYDIQLIGPLWLKAGWKPVVDVVKNPERTFIFRPYFNITKKV